jgi:hypothetical protein
VTAIKTKPVKELSLLPVAAMGPGCVKTHKKFSVISADRLVNTIKRNHDPFWIAPKMSKSQKAPQKKHFYP